MHRFVTGILYSIAGISFKNALLTSSVVPYLREQPVCSTRQLCTSQKPSFFFTHLPGLFQFSAYFDTQNMAEWGAEHHTRFVILYILQNLTIVSDYSRRKAKTSASQISGLS